LAEALFCAGAIPALETKPSISNAPTRNLMARM
jgi:hypothetical protein